MINIGKHHKLWYGIQIADLWCNLYLVRAMLGPCKKGNVTRASNYFFDESFTEESSVKRFTKDVITGSSKYDSLEGPNHWMHKAKYIANRKAPVFMVTEFPERLPPVLSIKWAESDSYVSNVASDQQECDMPILL